MLKEKYNSTAPLRIGFIGAGRIVERVHLPILNAMPEVVVVGLYDQDLRRAQTLASEFSIPKVCRSLDELFGLGADIAVVACPNDLHAEMSVSALKANMHVLCEKPMATSVAGAKAMIEAAEHAGRELLIGSTNRFRPDIEALQKAIQEGKLGEIRTIRCGWLRRKGIPGIGTWFTSRAQAGGGVLTDLGSHMIDLAIWLGGRRRLISAQCALDRFCSDLDQASWYKESIPAAQGAAVRRNLDVEITASGFAIFEGPLNVFIEVSWSSAVPHDQTYLHVMGSQGMARLETLFGLSPQGRRPERPLQLWTDASSEPHMIEGPVDALQPYRSEWKFFINSLMNGHSLRPWLSDGLAMMELIEAFYKSAQDIEDERSR